MLNWYEQWDSDVHKEYLNVMRLYTSDNKLHFSCNHITIDQGDQTIKITPPVYGDALHVLSTTTDPEKRFQIAEYIRFMRKCQITRDAKTFSEQQNRTFSDKIASEHVISPISAFVPICFIEKLPVIQYLSTGLSSNAKAKVVQKSKPQKSKKKSNVTHETKVKFISSAIARSLGVDVPFANKEQCSSRSTSAKHYISKADLLNIIKQHPALLEKVGKKYYAMSKEELCTKLFPNNNS